MADQKPKAYHTFFWRSLSEHPEVRGHFKDVGHNWERLPYEEKEVCLAADKSAWAEVHRLRSMVGAAVVKKSPEANKLPPHELEQVVDETLRRIDKLYTGFVRDELIRLNKPDEALAEFDRLAVEEYDFINGRSFAKRHIPEDEYFRALAWGRALQEVTVPTAYELMIHLKLRDQHGQIIDPEWPAKEND